MQLAEINKRIKEKFVKPNNENVKIGAVIRRVGMFGYRYCVIRDIRGGYIFGNFENKLEDAIKNDRRDGALNNGYVSIRIGGIDGVLNEIK
jgi:hypothetical protein